MITNWLTELFRGRWKAVNHWEEGEGTIHPKRTCTIVYFRVLRHTVTGRERKQSLRIGSDKRWRECKP